VKRVRPGRVLLAAFAALVYVFLQLPLLIVFPISFSSAQYLQFPPPGWSLQWYERYLGSPNWLTPTWVSLKVAVATTALSLLLGVPLAFGLTRARYPGRDAIEKLSMAPIIVPTIVLSIALYGLFAKLKLIGAWYGIATAHTLLALPFVVVLVVAGLRDFDVNQELAALGLGASRWQAVWHVTLPQIRPSLVSAAFLAFISSFDELVVAMFLGGANMTLPKKMFDNIRMEIDPTIAAISALQIVLVSALLALAARFGRGGGVPGR
jgi:putative spermidine/putrescine transport system permease protein